MRGSYQAKSLVVSAALLCAPLPGCSQLPGTLYGGQALAINSSDACGPQRAEFARSGSFFSDEIATRAATGAAVGTAAGALIGGLANGGQGALRGALAGLIGGVAAGMASAYWERLQQENLDRQTLSQAINDDLRTETASMDHAAASFATLRTCRYDQAQQIKSAAQRGLIGQGEAQGRLAQQRGWFDQEIALAQDVGVTMQRRDAQFTYAAEQLYQAPPPSYEAPQHAPARIQRDPTASAAVAATQTIPEKRNSFETAVESAKAQSVAVFSLDPSARTRNERRRYA